jgi:hypothetical protein
MKHARDMSESERQAALAELKRGPKPAPVEIETPKTAKEMRESERQEWLREHIRRFK